MEPRRSLDAPRDATKVGRRLCRQAGGKREAGRTDGGGGQKRHAPGERRVRGSVCFARASSQAGSPDDSQQRRRRLGAGRKRGAFFARRRGCRHRATVRLVGWLSAAVLLVSCGCAAELTLCNSLGRVRLLHSRRWESWRFFCFCPSEPNGSAPLPGRVALLCFACSSSISVRGMDGSGRFVPLRCGPSALKKAPVERTDRGRPTRGKGGGGGGGGRRRGDHQVDAHPRHGGSPSSVGLLSAAEEEQVSLGALASAPACAPTGHSLAAALWAGTCLGCSPPKPCEGRGQAGGRAPISFPLPAHQAGESCGVASPGGTGGFLLRAARYPCSYPFPAAILSLRASHQRVIFFKAPDWREKNQSK